MDMKRLKPVTNNPSIWEALDSYLKEISENKETELQNASDLHLIYRAQGYIRALKEVRKLKDRVNAEQN